MEIKVLGHGCSRCKQLFAAVQEVVRQSGRSVTLVKVEDDRAIMAHGVRQTPALVIDGVVRSTGRIPGADELAGWIADSAEATAR